MLFTAQFLNFPRKKGKEREREKEGKERTPRRDKGAGRSCKPTADALRTLIVSPVAVAMKLLARRISLCRD